MPTTVVAEPRSVSASSSMMMRPWSITSTCSSRLATSSIRWVERIDGARVLGVVLEQAVVEDLAGDGVEAEVRLVEEGQRGARGEADDDADRRELAAGELLDARG